VILRESDIGPILDGGESHGEILLPERYIDRSLELEPGDEIDVFIYCDSEDRVIATTECPKAEIGDFAALEVKDVTRIGAFLDWGLPKDLLLPHANQKGRLERGDRVVVKVLYDHASGRLYATQRLRPEREAGSPEYQPGQKVSGLVATQSEMGWTVVVDGTHIGLLFHNEVFRELREGDRIECYVREIRDEDERIDLSLEPLGYARIPPLRNRVHDAVKATGDGFLPLHDKSSPEAIQRAFDCSKKNFKKAIGALYRDGVIRIEADGIRLVESR